MIMMKAAETPMAQHADRGGAEAAKERRQQNREAMPPFNHCPASLKRELGCKCWRPIFPDMLSVLLTNGSEIFASSYRLPAMRRPGLPFAATSLCRAESTECYGFGTCAHLFGPRR